MSEDTSNLNPSSLGTKDYWDAAYETEIQNYRESGGENIGEVWFEEFTQTRIINWLKKHKISKDSSIIDLGTGNGAMLLELYNQDYKNLTGIDYSEKSIELARQIANDQGCKDIKFHVADLLCDVSSGIGKFKICHDKGTYDAIGLMEGAKDKKNLYVKNVWNLLVDDGWFIITSCNFCEEELVESFSDYFEKFEVIPSQTFKFAGKIGKTTTSIAFKKKKL